MFRNLAKPAAPTPFEAFGWAWQEGSAGAGPTRQGGALKRGSLRLSLPLPKSGRSRFPVRTLGAAAALSTALFAGGFLTFVGTIERAERPQDASVDGIVALTGGAQRIGDAIELLASGHGRRLLISGVNERTSREEIARLNPSQRHLIACCIDLDYRARNTIGNAIETRRWMRRHHFGTIAVVTSNYHMPRTLVELGNALDETESLVPYPVVTDGIDVGRWWAEPATARLLVGEYVKFLAAWLRTRFESDPEDSHFAVLLGRGRPPVKRVAERLMREAH